MAKASGIGGVFFRTPDPAATSAWYQQHLGIEPTEGGPFSVIQWSGGETTVWSPFDDDTEYFGPTDPPERQDHMVNYRVDDLDAMVAQLRDAGVPVDDHIEDNEYGKFGWAVDGDGHRFELWQPPAGQ